MAEKRYLCAELVTLRTRDGQVTVNLEEIWERGAVIEADGALETGALIQLRCGEVGFSGKITAAEANEFGWRGEIEFSPLTPWSVEAYRPGHLLDPSKLGE